MTGGGFNVGEESRNIRLERAEAAAMLASGPTRKPSDILISRRYQGIADVKRRPHLSVHALGGEHCPDWAVLAEGIYSKSWGLYELHFSAAGTSHHRGPVCALCDAAAVFASISSGR